MALTPRGGGGSVDIKDSFTIASPVDIEEVFPTHGTWKQLDAKTLEFDLGDAHLEVTIGGADAFTVSAHPMSEYGEIFTRIAVHRKRTPCPLAMGADLG